MGGKVIIDTNDLPPEQKKEIEKILKLNEATLPQINKFDIIKKIEAEQRAIRQARNNLGGKDGK